MGLTTILRISSGTFLLALHSACAEECEKITGALHSRDSLCCKTEIFLSCTSEIFFAKQRFFERADIDHNVVEFRKMKKC